MRSINNRLAAIVLVVAASTTGLSLSAADLPFTLGWEVMPNQPVQMWKTLLLPDGKVFASAYKKEDIYILDVDAKTWTKKTSSRGMLIKQNTPHDTMLPDGRIFRMSAGYTSDPVRAAIYDPRTDSWIRTAAPLYQDRVVNNIVASRTRNEVVVRMSSARGYKMISYDVDANRWADRPDLGSLTLFSNRGLDWIFPDLNAFGMFASTPVILDTDTWEMTLVNPRYSNGHHPSTWVLANNRVMYDIHAGEVGDVHVFDYYVSSFSERVGHKILSERPGDTYRSSMPFAMPVPGTDYLGWLSSPANNRNNWDAGFGEADAVKIYDHREGDVKFLRLPVPNGSGLNLRRLQRCQDGILFREFELNAAKRAVRYLKIIASEPPPPASIADDLPGTITMDEGGLVDIHWHVEGMIPQGGVDVIVERMHGDGDVRVVSGAQVHVDYRHDSQTARIAALMDGDSNDDTATLRFRVVQPRGGMDPNARTVTVRVNDRFEMPTHRRGDVNGDGVVNAADLQEVIDNFGTRTNGN